jgi:hypothetical protein
LLSEENTGFTQFIEKFIKGSEEFYSMESLLPDKSVGLAKEGIWIALV